MMIDTLFEYIRMVSYGVVILSSLRNIAKRRFNNLLFVGDIIMASFLLVGGVLARFFGFDRDDSVSYIITPPVIIWAVIHFYAMIRGTKLRKGK